MTTVVGSATNASTSGLQTLTVALSGIAGLTTGDVLIASYLYCNSKSPTAGGNSIASRSAGWTPLVDDHAISGGSGQIDIIYTVYSAGTTVDPSWTVETDPDTVYNKSAAQVVAYRSAGTPTLGTPFDRVTTSTSTTVPSLTATAGSVTTAVFCDKVSNQTTATGPVEMTTQTTRVLTGGGGGSLMMCTEPRAAAGATGTRTATYGITASLAYGVLIDVPTAALLAPDVDAGAAQSVAAGATVTLTATNVGGAMTTSSWTQTAGSPTVSLSGTGNTRTFTAPSGGSTTTLTFTFSGTNSVGTDSDTVSIDVAAVGGGTVAVVVGHGDNLTTAGTQTLAVPLTEITGLANGDLIVAAYQYNGNPTNEEVITARAAGWNSLVTQHQISGLGALIDIMWTVRSASTVNPSWTMSVPVAPGVYNKASCGAVAFRNVGTPVLGTPVDRSGSGLTTVAPSITATAGSFVLGIFGEKVSDQTSVTGPPEMTTQVSILITGGSGGTLLMATEARASAGATGTRTSTNGVASATGYGVLMNVPFSATVAPAVYAGPDQTVEPYIPCALAGTISGSYTSFAWTQVSGPTIALSSTTVLAPTFQSPGTVAGATAVFKLTGNNAGTSSSSNVSITFLPSSERSIVGGVAVPASLRSVNSAIDNTAPATFFA